MTEVWKLYGKTPVWRPTCGRADGVKLYVKEIKYYGKELI